MAIIVKHNLFDAIPEKKTFSLKAIFSFLNNKYPECISSRLLKVNFEKDSFKAKLYFMDDYPK